MAGTKSGEMTNMTSIEKNRRRASEDNHRQTSYGGIVWRQNEWRVTRGIVVCGHGRIWKNSDRLLNCA